MTTGNAEQINAAKDMILALLFEMRSVFESPECDSEAAEAALKEIDSTVSLTKTAFMLSGHTATFGEAAEEHTSHTRDGRKKHVHCVELGKTYRSAAEASRDTGINSGNLNQALRGNLATAGGFHWIFVDPDAKSANISEKLG